MYWNAQGEHVENDDGPAVDVTDADPIRPPDPPIGGPDFTGSTPSVNADTGGLATALGTVANGFFSAPTSAPLSPQQAYKPPGEAWSAGTDQSGDPLFQLKDAAGNIIQWAIDTAGQAFGYKNLGPAGLAAAVGDPRAAYTPPAGAKAAGTDTSGNPLYQIVDAAGNLVQWAIDAGGQAINFLNLGPANPTSSGPAAPPAATTSAPLVGTGGPNTNILNTLSNILTGNNAPAGLNGGFTLAPTTIAPTTTNTNLTSDSSNRSSANTNISTTYQTSNSVNSPDLFNSLVDKIKSLWGTPQTAASATPLNDAAFTAGKLQPGFFSSGQTLDRSQGMPGSKIPAAAVVTGAPSGTLSDPTMKKLMLIAIVIAALTLIVFIFKKR